MSRVPRNPLSPATAAVPAPVGPGSEIFVGRQPILNSDQQLVAYELLFRDSRLASGARVGDGAQATCQLIVSTFNNLGVERVLGDRRAFINVNEPLLGSDVVTLLPPDKVVLEILEDVPPTAEVVERCRRLKEAGYQLALDDFRYRPEFEPLLKLVSYVKLDIRALGLSGVAKQAGVLRGRGLRLLAEKVETREEFRALRGQLINYYQGYYFARPETLSMKRVDPSVQQVMRLFNLVSGGAEPAQVEAGFRQDVALSYSLLRYINSAGFGLVHKVETIRHALVVLGNTKLARWLTLLLFSSSRSNNPAPQALFRLVLSRARFMEQAGGQRLGAAHHDFLFMTGMFSLLDAMLDAPLAASVASLQLPEAVRDALLEARGPYAPFLELSRAGEQPDPERLLAQAHALGFTGDQIAHLQMDALAWAEQVASAA